MAESTWLAARAAGGGSGGDGERAAEHPAPRDAGSPSGPPPHSGLPWTDAEYEQTLAAAREGVTGIEHVAGRIGRAPQTTLLKARRLLPVAERSAPGDRVLRLLREHQADPAYDWQRVTLEDPLCLT